MKYTNVLCFHILNTTTKGDVANKLGNFLEVINGTLQPLKHNFLVIEGILPSNLLLCKQHYLQGLTLPVRIGVETGPPPSGESNRNEKPSGSASSCCFYMAFIAIRRNVGQSVLSTSDPSSGQRHEPSKCLANGLLTFAWQTVAIWHIYCNVDFSLLAEMRMAEPRK